MSKAQAVNFDISKYPYYSLEGKNLNTLALEIAQKPKLLTNQDVIFEGNGQKAIDGSVISIEKATAEDIAFLLSDMKKPAKWKGKVILLGDYTAQLCMTVSRAYYGFTGETIEVLGFKTRLSTESKNDDSVMWFSSKKGSNVVFGPQFKTVDDYCEFLETLPEDLKEEFEYIRKIYAYYFEFILKDKDEKVEAFKYLEKELIDSGLSFKFAIKNSRLMCTDEPLYKEKFTFGQVFSEINKFLNSCLVFTKESMYKQLEYISIEELSAWIVTFEKELDLRKKQLDKIITDIEELIHFLRSKKVKKVLDLADENTVSTIKYSPEIEQ